MLSQVCEEFHCTPSQALKEDAETVESILSVRFYVRAYWAVKTAQGEDDATEAQKAAVFEVVEAMMEGRANGL